MVGWLAAELVAFMLLARTIGLGGTILLGLATTVIGIVLLRRTGLDAMRGLRRAAQTGSAPDGALPDGLLAAFGGLLLVLPGFIANTVGLALSAPSVRRGLVHRYGGAAPLPRRPARPDVIDLSPSDWRPVDRA